MKKNGSFVNLFLEESTRPAPERTAERHLEANGIVVNQAAITMYADETGG